jgi:PAS domain S-box-containing protein
MDAALPDKQAELQQALQALHSSERKLRLMLDQIPSLLWITDQNLSVTEIMGAERMRLQHERSSYLGQTIEEGLRAAHVSEAEVQAALQAHHEALAGRRGSYDVTIRGRSFAVTVESLRGAAGTPVGCLALATDVTMRKQEEAQTSSRLQELAQQVAQSRDLLRMVFDGVPDAFLLLDSSCTVRLANQPLAAILGMHPAALVGQSWSQLCAQGKLPFDCLWIVEALSANRNETRRVRYSDPAGHTHVCDIIVQPLPATADSSQLLVRFADCTERLQLEAIAIQSERFIASGTLAAMVAHEVNTPLQAINNFLFLIEAADSAERARFLALARDELGRVGRTLRQLLDLYRPLSPTFGPIDLNALAERVLLLTQGTCERQGIAVEAQLSAQLPPVWGRADHLMQLALNLVMNAIEAMPDGGRLLITTSSDVGSPQILLRVSDTGEGVPPELHERAFEPFVTTKPNGTGLGLAICRNIAGQHNGQVLLERHNSKGARFVVRLPAALNAEA